MHDDILAGSPRLLRKLGEGERAEVFLAGLQAESGEVRVAVKRYRAATPRASIEREIEALARAEHAHAMRLIDVDADEHNGLPLPVLERLPRGSLVALLERRGRLRAGEAVTVLAPIAQTVDALHRAGVVHGGLGAAAVLFRTDGAPVLARFGRAELRAPGTAADRDADVALRADREALAGLVEYVLACTEATTPELIDRIVGDRHADGFGEKVAARLFAWAPAQPISFDAPAPASAITPRVTTESSPVGSPVRWNRLVLARLERLAPAAITDRVVAAADGARRVRRPVWVAAVAGVISLAAAVIVVALPQPSSDGRTPTVAPSLSPVATPDADEPEDPVAALSALVAVRESCLDALSEVCLDRVDQQGSSAEADDRAVISALRGGALRADLPRVEVDGARIDQELGDSVLVGLPSAALNAPTAVLVMRTAVGWRIRDYLGD